MEKEKNSKMFFDAIMRFKRRGMQRNLDAVHEAIAAINVNVCDSDGFTPLSGLTRFLSGEDAAVVTRLLIKAGADVNLRDDIGGTPLGRAAFCGELKTMEALLEAHADVNGGHDACSGGWTPLHTAAEPRNLSRGLSRGRDIESVKMLLDKDADANIHCGEEGTPLHLAARYIFTDIAKALLDGGAKIDAQDGTGRTPLHIASRSSRDNRYNIVDKREMIEVLLNAKADVNAQDKHGWTPLHHAANLIYETEMTREKVERTESVVKVLLDAGADPSIGDKNGKTVLDYVRERLGFSPSPMTKSEEALLHRLEAAFPVAPAKAGCGYNRGPEA